MPALGSKRTKSQIPENNENDDNKFEDSLREYRNARWQAVAPATRLVPLKPLLQINAQFRRKLKGQIESIQLHINVVSGQDWLAKGLVLCLDELGRFIFVLRAEARSFSGERINAVEFPSPNVPADEAES